MLWLAVFLLAAVGCSDHWLAWGNPETRFGQANLWAYEVDGGNGGVLLGLECRADYPDDPSVVFEILGGTRYAGDVAVTLVWDDQRAIQQAWKGKRRYTIATENQTLESYWVYLSGTSSRMAFLSTLTHSEHLAVELTDSAVAGDVVRAEFKTKGAGRVLERLAEYCRGEG